MKPFASAALLLAALPAAALADPFADFRIPDHSWRSGFLDGNVSGARSATGQPGDESRQNSLYSNLSTSLLLARDSDPLQHALSLGLSGSFDAWERGNRTSFSPNYGERVFEGRSQSVSESWRLDGSLRAYPWQSPLGIGLAGFVTGSYGQAWNRSSEEWTDWPGQRREQGYRSDRHDYLYDVLLSAFAGLGRVRDATVVYDTWVLEKRLRETGALARPLSRQAREKLAALYFVAPFYGTAHDRPDRYVWTDMERILREDGALGERGLDPYSLLRGRERYARLRVLRLRGWFAGPVLQDRHSHEVRRSDQSSYFRDYLADTLRFGTDSSRGDRNVTSFDEVNLGAQAEYHLPMGWRWQLDVASRATVPVRPGWNGLNASASAQAAWLIADRWEALISLSHFRDILKRERGDLLTDSWSVNYGVQLSWYVEDHVQLNAGVWESQARRISRFSPLTRGFSRSAKLQIGFSYRFLGALDAPGLIEPVRLMR